MTPNVLLQDQSVSLIDAEQCMGLKTHLVGGPRDDGLQGIQRGLGAEVGAGAVAEKALELAVQGWYAGEAWRAQILQLWEAGQAPLGGQAGGAGQLELGGQT